MKTITGHFQWDGQGGQWRAVDERRRADNLVLAELNPDQQGISPWLTIGLLLPALPEEYRPRIAGNGSNMFNRGRGLAKDFRIEKQGRGRIVAVRCTGLVPQIERSQAIRGDLARAIRQLPCVVLATHQDIEPDHKVGRKNERRLEDLSLQMIEDFQPLNSTVNDVKRTHCRRCQETRSRFDARALGYRHGWWIGDATWEVCVGCYWHDPARFNAELSRNFEPK